MFTNCTKLRGPIVGQLRSLSIGHLAPRRVVSFSSKALSALTWNQRVAQVLAASESPSLAPSMSGTTTPTEQKAISNARRKSQTTLLHTTLQHVPFASNADALWTLFSDQMSRHLSPDMAYSTELFACFVHAAERLGDEGRYMTALLNHPSLGRHHVTQVISHLIREESKRSTKPTLCHYLFNRFISEYHPSCRDPHVYAAMISSLVKFNPKDALHLCSELKALGVQDHSVVQLAKGKLLAKMGDKSALAELAIRNGEKKRNLVRRMQMNWRAEVDALSVRYKQWLKSPRKAPANPGKKLRNLESGEYSIIRQVALRELFGMDDVHLVLLLDELGIGRHFSELERVWMMSLSMGYPLNVNHYTSYAEGLAYKGDVASLTRLLQVDMPARHVVPSVKLMRNVLGILFQSTPRISTPPMKGGIKQGERGKGNEGMTASAPIHPPRATGRLAAQELFRSVMLPLFPDVSQEAVLRLGIPKHLKAVYFSGRGGALP